MPKLNLPNLIIAGVHKAATTSLFTYLTSHPQIFGSAKKELHYFTPIRYGEKLKELKEYAKYFSAVTNEKYVLDASPSYIYGKESIILKMKEILPPHKVIIVLRDPVQRFISFYNYLKAQLILDPEENLSLFLKKCIKNCNGVMVDNKYSRAIQEGRYIDYLPAWMENYGEDLKIIYFEELVAQPGCVMLELAQWLKIDSSPFEKMEYTVENKTIYAKNRFLHSFALLINNKLESFWRQNHALKIKLRDFYYSFNKNGRQKKEYDLNSLNELQKVYYEANKKLKLYLQQKNLKIPSWLINITY